MTAKTKRAFTLIELLVTIVIIGILAALLLTALSSVRLKAQRIHCLNNVKQLALGSFMYASDYSRHAGVEAPAFPGGNWRSEERRVGKECRSGGSGEQCKKKE